MGAEVTASLHAHQDYWDVGEAIVDIPIPATIWQETHGGIQGGPVEELPNWAPINPQNHGQIKTVVV